MGAYLMPLNQGKRIALNKAILFVGRHPECDVLLTESRKISRKHCCIAQVNDVYIIRDLGSMNGVHVNGQRVDKEARIAVGDEVVIGDCRYVLKIGAPNKGDAKSADQEAGIPASMQAPSARPAKAPDPGVGQPPKAGRALPLSEERDARVADEPLDDSPTPDVIPLLDPDKDKIDDLEFIDFADDDDEPPLDEEGEYKDSGSQVELMPE